MNAPAGLDARELAAVAALWRSQRRMLDTAFEGTSMLPAIAPGATVRVECGREPEPGQVAMFTFERGVGVHRVVCCRDDWLLTWGDANPLPDGPVRRAQVIGTLRDVPAIPHSLRRRCLLALLAPRGAGWQDVNRRVATAHGVLQAMRAGLRTFLATCWRKLARRGNARPRPAA